MTIRFLFFGWLVLLRAAAGAQAIQTVAGNGTVSVTGGTAAVAVDAAGNVYSASGGGNSIHRTTPSMVTITFAGTGQSGYSGDNGPAGEATFSNIQDLYISKGILYVADTGNRRIRQIDLSSGIVTTAAGDGTTAITGSGLGAATAVAVDWNGNLYVSGGGTHVIRKVTPDHVYSTFAGTGVAGFSGDGGPATDADLNLPSDLFVSGNTLYIADMVNRRIRGVNLTDQTIHTVAGDGTTGTTGTGIGAAAGVAVDGDGVIFVATGGSGNAIRKIAGTAYTTLTGGNTPGSFSGDGGDPALATLNLPVDLYIHDNSLYIADQGNRRIRAVHGVAAPMPLKLVSFSAGLAEHGVSLRWVTTMETDVYGFTVEKSRTGRSFEPIGFVSASGNPDLGQTSYSFDDPDPDAGRSFYRLRMEDRDGTFRYSTIESVYRSKGAGGLVLGPVPARNQLHVRVNHPKMAGRMVAVRDVTGRQVTRLLLAEEQVVDISAWVPGIYFLQADNGDSYRFVKE